MNLALVTCTVLQQVESPLVLIRFKKSWTMLAFFLHTWNIQFPFLAMCLQMFSEGFFSCRILLEVADWTFVTRLLIFSDYHLLLNVH